MSPEKSHENQSQPCRAGAWVSGGHLCELNWVGRGLAPAAKSHKNSGRAHKTRPYNTAVGLYKLCGRFMNRPYGVCVGFGVIFA